MITYIIVCKNGEVYCGKTNNMKKRFKEHKKEKYPHWFCNEERKKWVGYYIFKGDYEKKIKKFGVNNIIRLVNTKKYYFDGEGLPSPSGGG